MKHRHCAQFIAAQSGTANFFSLYLLCKGLGSACFLVHLYSSAGFVFVLAGQANEMPPSNQRDKGGKDLYLP